MTENYKDVHNKKHLMIQNAIFDMDRDVGIELVLENGDSIIELTKKAQQQSAELNKTLEYIQKFIPQFRLK